MSQVVLHEGVAAATPATGKVTLYAKTDGLLYSKDDAGTETPLRGDVAAATHAATIKPTPVNEDEIPLADSADSWGIKKLTWSNLKTTLATWLETLTATWSNKTLTSPTVASNLTFSGTGNRITGDFSSATVADRTMFQTSTVNGASYLAVIPNGTGSVAGNYAFNNSDPANASYGSLAAVGSTEVRVTSNRLGTGTYLPLMFYTGGAGTPRVTIDTSGNIIQNVNTSAPSLATNQQMVFALTSNTNLRISVRGTDGTTRVANITLA